MNAYLVVGGVAYWLVGYALAFGGGNPFCGVKYWAHMDMPANLLAHWFFHFVFAATAATIVSGAMAERCDFVAYLVYSFVITGRSDMHHRHHHHYHHRLKRHHCSHHHQHHYCH